MTTTAEKIDARIAQREQLARKACERAIDEVAAGAPVTDDVLDTVVKAGMPISEFRSRVERKARKHELTMRIQQLQRELESRLQPTMEGEAVFEDGEWRPYAAPHTSPSMDAQKRFNEFMEKRRQHEERKPELRNEIARLRAELATLPVEDAD